MRWTHEIQGGMEGDFDEKHFVQNSQQINKK